MLQTLTPQQIDELSSILEPIKDLQSAVLELNDALRLDVPEIDDSKSEYILVFVDFVFSLFLLLVNCGKKKYFIHQIFQCRFINS